MTIAFALVSAVALGISFYSAGKMKRGERQVVLLQSEVEKLSQTEKNLRGNLQEVQTRYVQETAATQDLRRDLLQEELKSQVLSQELQKQKRPQKTAQNVEASESKVSGSANTNFSSKNSAVD